MKRQSPTRSHSDKDCDREREKERERRRRLWLIQQKKEREHEQLKQKKIEEYERKRAEILKQESVKEREHSRRSHSYSRSRSKSEERPHRNYSRTTSSRAARVMSEKLNSTEGNKPFFKGPIETMKIKEEELREITVKIVRKIPGPATETSEIRRDILNPEDVTLKRREVYQESGSDYELKWLQTHH